MINEDSEIYIDDSETDDLTLTTWSGESLTLTTTIDGDEIEFCANAIIPGVADNSEISFGIAWWTDDSEFDPTNPYDGPYDGLMFRTEGSGFYPYDISENLAEDNQDWTLTSEEETCDIDSGTCEFDVCATRALETGEEYDIDLPFQGGDTKINAFVDMDDGTRMVFHEAAISLGLALLATAGTAFALV